MDNRDRKPDPLSGAINQLEALLDEQAPTDNTLPILDEMIDAETDMESDDDETPDAADEDTDDRIDPAAVEQALGNTMDRLTRQMESELQALASVLKANMLEEFRKEMSAALGTEHDSAAATDDEPDRDHG